MQIKTYAKKAFVGLFIVFPNELQFLKIFQHAFNLVQVLVHLQAFYNHFFYVLCLEQEHLLNLINRIEHLTFEINTLL